MAKRIGFSVVFATDEEQDYPSSELNAHGPTVVGWRCRQDSTITPKEIILRFHKPAVICRIQVLAHQYMIPERIELWVHYSPKGVPTTPSSQTYDYLGFITLSNNSSTNYKSRELQSTPVGPKRGTHLKLRISSAHHNDLNTSNQLALIAVNVLGEDLDTENAMQMIQGLNNERTESAIASICDDLSFSMYVEESIAEVIRKMELKKSKAVNDERFEFARKLKLCMNALRNAGERLGRYSLAKRQAVQQEDFMTAKLRKEQIEMYRNSVFEQLQVDILLESNGVCPQNDAVSELYAQKPSLPSPPSLQDVASTLTTESTFASLTMSPKTIRRENSDHSTTMTRSPQINHVVNSPKRGSPNSGSLRRRNRSVPRNSYEDYEEQAVPALRHSHTNEFLRECQGAAVLENDPCRGRSRLNERERRQAALSILVFGNEMVEMFYSRQFQDREDALIRLTSILKGESFDFSVGVNKIARSTTMLLHRAVRDAVFSVFNLAAETVRALFIEFIPNRVTASEVPRCVDRLLPELLSKSGDPSARIHTLAQHTILCIASCPEVKMQHLIAPSLSRPVGSGTHPRLALSRMQMLEQLVLSQGISTDKQSGLTCRSLSESGCSGIHHPAEPVRKVAERVLLLVYKVNPRLVRKQLPPDDDITRRNLLYRQLFTEFDKLDAERRKELMMANRRGEQFTRENASSLPTSPPISDSVRCKSANAQEGSKFGFNGKGLATQKNGVSGSPRKQLDIFKSKSGNTINGMPDSAQTLFDTKYELKRSSNGGRTDSARASASANTSGMSSNSGSFEDSDTENHCPFCDWTYSGGSDQLDRHYWKACPILNKCPQCSQVLEVAALNAHLTEECDAKIAYVKCARCTEAVHKNLLEIHMLEDFCVPLTKGAAKCPLCHNDVKHPSNGGWKQHLLSPNGCPGTARRRSKI